MIVSWKDDDALKLWLTGKSTRIASDLRKVVIRKLSQLEAAVLLTDLASPPGNRLEALKGDRAGQHSIRVNDQFRLCFIWRDGNVHNVEFTDYH